MSNSWREADPRKQKQKYILHSYRDFLMTLIMPVRRLFTKKKKKKKGRCRVKVSWEQKSVKTSDSQILNRDRNNMQVLAIIQERSGLVVWPQAGEPYLGHTCSAALRFQHVNSWSAPQICWVSLFSSEIESSGLLLFGPWAWIASF